MSGKLEQIDGNLQQMNGRFEQIDDRLNMLQTEQKEMKKEITADIRRMDKKIDKILDYFEYIDADLQRHKTAGNV